MHRHPMTLKCTGACQVKAVGQFCLSVLENAGSGQPGKVSERFLKGRFV